MLYPHERSLVEKYEGKPFVLLGVNSDPDEVRDRVKQLMAEKGLSWRSWWAGGPGGEIPTRWQVEGWPTMYLIDPDGTLRAKVEPTDLLNGKLERAIDRLLIEMEMAKKG